MNKKILGLVGVATLALGALVILPSTSLAYRGDASVKGPNYTVERHDAMEKIITAADAKDANQLLAVYPEVDLKLKEVEAIVNDSEIQTIRTKLEEVVSLAKEGKVELLSAKAAEMKSAFVKVYLKRG